VSFDAKMRRKIDHQSRRFRILARKERLDPFPDVPASPEQSRGLNQSTNTTTAAHTLETPAEKPGTL